MGAVGTSAGRAANATVVVTGGSSGIGLATAKAFAARGLDVGLIARNPENLAAAAAEVESARRDETQKVAFATGDVADHESFAAAMRVLGEELGFAAPGGVAAAGSEGAVGAPDILVNAAGIFIPGRFEELPLDLFREHLDIDVMGVIHGCKLVAPAMIARGTGHLVNVSSSVGFVGLYGYTAYSTAKFAVMGFSEVLRQEMKVHGVQVHVVCPSDVDTPGLEKEKAVRTPEMNAIAGNVKEIPPEKVGEAIAKGVERGDYAIFADAMSRIYYRLKGVAPELFYAVTDGQVKKARQGKG